MLYILFMLIFICIQMGLLLRVYDSEGQPHPKGSVPACTHGWSPKQSAQAERIRREDAGREDEEEGGRLLREAGKHLPCWVGHGGMI